MLHSGIIRWYNPLKFAKPKKPGRGGWGQDIKHAFDHALKKKKSLNSLNSILKFTLTQLKLQCNS